MSVLKGCFIGSLLTAAYVAGMFTAPPSGYTVNVAKGAGKLWACYEAAPQEIRCADLGTFLERQAAEANEGEHLPTFEPQPQVDALEL